MNFTYVFEKAKFLILKPAEAWLVIKSKEPENQRAITDYAMPLIVLGVVSTLIGTQFYLKDASLEVVGKYGLMAFLIPYFNIYASVFFIEKISASFLSLGNKNAITQLVIYSTTASYVSSIIVNIHPLFYIFSIFSFYFIYLLWVGLPIMLNTPREKRTSFAIMIVLVMQIIEFLTVFLLKKMLF